MDSKKSIGINTLKSGCLLLKIDSEELPLDTQITYNDCGKIILRDSIGNSAAFETNELIILHSKTIVVNSSAYIITAPNVARLAGHRYYIRDNQLHSEAIPNEDSDDEGDAPITTDGNDSDESDDASDADDADESSDGDLSD
ncbi:hypothetical protein F-S17_0415 [Faustovirus]|nr:hypothetical protein F-M6_0423 [Faustovirus]QJX72681.1 hypothetical protein F-S17_0415 [Faustovirus]QJX74191.1 hypothetical protein F-E9_438 [Faustovirus]